MDLETAVAIAREVWGLELPEGNAAAGGDDSLQPKPLDSYDDNNFFLVQYASARHGCVRAWVVL